MTKLKIEEAGSLSKFERQNLQRLHMQGAAAYGSVRNLAKLADYHYQSWDSFYIQRIPKENLIGNTKIQEKKGFC